jgi:ankyrin repeat protein
MSCRGKAAAAIVKESKMSRVSSAFLMAILTLVPATAAGAAAGFIKLAEAQDGAAAAVQDDAGGLSQDHIKEIFFDAARAGRNDLLDGLIRSGMKPDERDPHSYTALILAAYNGKAATVDFLIQKGANPCATDAKGNSSLMGVAFKGETAIAQRLIAAHCDVNARNGAGQTALMMATMFGQTDVVKLLLANGANLMLQDGAGNTAMTLAQQQANPQMVALLTQAIKGQ